LVGKKAEMLDAKKVVPLVGKMAAVLESLMAEMKAVRLDKTWAVEKEYQ
jgi:hypothetical protein